MSDTNRKFLGPVSAGRYVCPKCGTPSAARKEEDDNHFGVRCHNCGEDYRTLSGALWVTEYEWETLCPQCHVPVTFQNGTVTCPECKCQETLPEIAVRELEAVRNRRT